MPVNQLRRQSVQHVIDRERGLLLRHLSVEEHLQQQVSQFTGQFGPIAIVDGFQDFVSFFEGVGLDGIEGLLAVPRTSAWRAQPLHDGHRAFETFSCARHSATTVTDSEGVNQCAASPSIPSNWRCGSSHSAANRIQSLRILPVLRFRSQAPIHIHSRRKTMATATLHGKKIAILATDGFEQAELLEPRKALDQAGAKTQVVSPKEGKIRGWNHKDWGQEVSVDVPLKSAKAEDYDALLLPGGVMNPDQLRMIPEVVAFVKHFTDAGKPVAAICHGPWTLIEAGAVRGKTITSWPSLKTDLKNAGATWQDKEVIRDGNLVTSRKPDDIPAFNKEMIRLIEEGAKQAPLRKTA